MGYISFYDYIFYNIFGRSVVFVYYLLMCKLNMNYYYVVKF